MTLRTSDRGTLSDMPGRYVGTGEAAEEIGVSRNTLERWARAGWVTPATKTAGGHYRWELEDLRRQVADRADQIAEERRQD